MRFDRSAVRARQLEAFAELLRAIGFREKFEQAVAFLSDGPDEAVFVARDAAELRLVPSHDAALIDFFLDGIGEVLADVFDHCRESSVSLHPVVDRAATNVGFYAGRPDETSLRKREQKPALRIIDRARA